MKHRMAFKELSFKFEVEKLGIMVKHKQGQLMEFHGETKNFEKIQMMEFIFKVVRNIELFNWTLFCHMYFSDFNILHSVVSK